MDATQTDGQLAPGLTSDGLADANALVNAHAERLSGESVTLHERRVRRYENGTLASWTNLTLRTAANRTRFLVNSKITGRPVYGVNGGHVVTFGDGEGIYRSVETPNTSWSTTLWTANGDPREPESLGLDTARTDDLYVLLSTFALNDSENVRKLGDDRASYRLESSTLAYPDLLASHLELDAVRNASLTAVVSDDGLVTEYRLEFVGTKNGTLVRGTTVLQYSNLGETEVETPKWYDEVNERTKNETA